MSIRPVAVALLLVLPALWAGAAVAVGGAPAAPVAGGPPVDLPGLENVVRLSDRLYSGGVPVGDEGFRTLQRLGVRTLLTVDGAPPDLAAARRFGMRYVHLPFGYDGCPAPTAARIVKAVRDLPGPVYVHCHHGKHRSPAAAVFARIALDGVSPEQAVREMERAGTGRNYVGLYGDVRRFQPPSREELDRLPAGFPESAPVPPLVASMAALEVRLDRLLTQQRAGWPADRRADAAHEALQLRELYAEMNRTDEVRRRPSDFRRWMTEAEQEGSALEDALRAGRGAEANRALGRIVAGCGSCHARYRNLPGLRVRR